MPTTTRVATVTIQLSWDERRKHWVLSASHSSPGDRTNTRYRYVDTTAEVDIAAMVMLSSAVAQEMESWLAA